MPRENRPATSDRARRTVDPHEAAWDLLRLVWIQLLWLAAGLVLLLTGGEALVRGASALARRLGVSATVIGLTVVAFGTSAPELSVSVLAASSGSGGIAFGNVVGSNIANVALLLGVTALLVRLEVHSDIVTREVPMLLVASTAMVLVSMDATIDGQATSVVSRIDGLMLLLLFAIFLYYTARSTLRERRDSLLSEARVEAPGKVAEESLRVSLILVGYGLLGLALGGDLLVDSSSAIARAVGVPEVVIGMTIVAVGTSLPELATCVAAARKGEADLAVGNIVGSNLFNMLFVLATAACVAPLPVPEGSLVDLGAMWLLAVALLPIVMTDQRSITRGEGGFLVAAYVAFLAWQATR